MSREASSASGTFRTPRRDSKPSTKLLISVSIWGALPPVTPPNSSQPPARESGQRRDAPPGHEKAERPLVEKPDTVIDARVTVCANCGADLSAVAARRVAARDLKCHLTRIVFALPFLETHHKSVIDSCEPGAGRKGNTRHRAPAISRMNDTHM